MTPVEVLIAHQRKDAESCICGWSQWGASHAEHIWRVMRLHLREEDCRPPDEEVAA